MIAMAAPIMTTMSSMLGPLLDEPAEAAGVMTGTTGAFVTKPIGWNVGGRVGIAVTGCCVLEGVGWLVTTFVGAEVGHDGADVGSPGRGVGVPVGGADVGFAVGGVVGRVVGVAVGRAVGAVVGLVVGMSVVGMEVACGVGADVVGAEDWAGHVTVNLQAPDDVEKPSTTT